jgi:sulfatase maturation enzyme AslB (radical SAM superfamily)
MIELNHPWLYHIRFNICSNGLLYNTPKVQEFFKKYHNFISFSISLDGNKELHDKCRIDLNNNGTYDRVVESIELH